MTLIIERNVDVNILEKEYNVEKEIRYENVSNIYMEGKPTRHLMDNGEWVKCQLILFKDPNHQELLNQAYVYLFDKDVMRIE